MASLDYRDCDQCGCKVFYMANMCFEDENGDWRPDPIGVGDWSVLCEECAESWETVILPNRK